MNFKEEKWKDRKTNGKRKRNAYRMKIDEKQIMTNGET